MGTRREGWSLARQLLLLQLAGIVVLVAVGSGLAWLEAARAINDRARNEVIAVARTVADAPSVLTAVTGPNPTGVLQPFAERVRTDTEVDFITIMNLGGVRYTHPDPSVIGLRFIGNTEAAIHGQVLTETYTGTLGPSMRAVVPVFDPAHRVVALVAVGIKISALSAELTARLVPLFSAALAVLAVGGVGSWLVSRRLRRETRGLAPAELSSVFASYEATLHAVREGLVLVAPDGSITLCNDGARDLLGLEANPEGTNVSALPVPTALAEAMCEVTPRIDEIHVTDTRVLVLNTARVRAGQRDQGNVVQGRVDQGNVVTLRDHTDLQLLTGELNTTRGLAEALRSQAHEAANRLHTVVSLVELGRPAEAIEFATAELAVAQELTDRVVGAVSEPVLAALLLGKAAEAHERGVELDLTEDTALGDLDLRGVEPRALITILGNLVDNAIDAAIEGAGEHDGRPTVLVTAKVADGELLLRVSDTGRGVPDTARNEVFQRGWSTKSQEGPVGHGLGLALVGQAVRRYRGRIDLANEGGAVFTVRLPLLREAVR
ncbi:MAG TPA: sensor histidine kinase [Pseudonocardia sp.]|nr:sensor histidine kinase [Pseudonocardia sp.]